MNVEKAITAARANRDALLRRPGVLGVGHGWKMIAHTFRGSTLRSLLGLEDERKAFARYRALRNAERAYV